MFLIILEFCKARGIDQIPLSSSANLPATICTTTAALATHGNTTKLTKSAVRLNNSALNRKSEIDFINGLDRKKKHEDDFMRRRWRSINNTTDNSSSSSGVGICVASEVEDEIELKELLAQTRNRLEHTNALRVRSHLLRPEDYVRYENPSMHFCDSLSARVNEDDDGLQVDDCMNDTNRFAKRLTANALLLGFVDACKRRDMFFFVLIVCALIIIYLSFY